MSVKGFIVWVLMWWACKAAWATWVDPTGGWAFFWAAMSGVVIHFINGKIDP